MQDFEALQGQAATAESLQRLFELWKEAHSVEEKWKDTCVFSDERAKANFTEDGRLGQAETGGVLFICKESNVERDTSFGKFGKKEFWMRKEVLLSQEDTDPKWQRSDANIKRSRTCYYNCLSETLHILSERGYHVPKQLQDCAYINLNKRGGKAVCNQKKLAKYISQYKAFIQREIELLQCDTAVLYSASSYKSDDIKEILHEAGVKHIIEINCHPSRYSKTKLQEIPTASAQ